MKKIGVFGGTFNPIHRGHEKIAREFYDKFAVDKLLVIPAFVAPHKEIDAQVSPSQRFEMCRLAFDSHESDESGAYKKYNIEVSDIEIKKEGRSYSIDTVTALYEIYDRKDNVIYFLIGTDMFLSIESWHRYEELLELCVFVVAYRFDDEPSRTRILSQRDRLVGRGYKIELLENAVFEVSSTELREKIKTEAKKNDIELCNYLNKDVIEYINRENLYT